MTMQAPTLERQYATHTEVIPNDGDELVVRHLSLIRQNRHIIEVESERVVHSITETCGLCPAKSALDMMIRVAQEKHTAAMEARTAAEREAYTVQVKQDAEIALAESALARAAAEKAEAEARMARANADKAEAEARMAAAQQPPTAGHWVEDAGA